MHATVVLLRAADRHALALSVIILLAGLALLAFRHRGKADSAQRDDANQGRENSPHAHLLQRSDNHALWGHESLVRADGTNGYRGTDRRCTMRVRAWDKVPIRPSVDRQRLSRKRPLTTTAPGSSASDMIRSLSSAGQRRRRSTVEMISAAMCLTVLSHVLKDSMLHPIRRSPASRLDRSREGTLTLFLERMDKT